MGSRVSKGGTQNLKGFLAKNQYSKLKSFYFVRVVQKCKILTLKSIFYVKKDPNLFKQAHITYEAKPRGGHFMLLVWIVLLVAIETFIAVGIFVAIGT